MKSIAAGPLALLACACTSIEPRLVEGRFFQIGTAPDAIQIQIEMPSEALCAEFLERFRGKRSSESLACRASAARGLPYVGYMSNASAHLTMKISGRTEAQCRLFNRDVPEFPDIKALKPCAAT